MVKMVLASYLVERDDNLLRDKDIPGCSPLRLFGYDSSTIKIGRDMIILLQYKSGSRSGELAPPTAPDAYPIGAKILFLFDKLDGNNCRVRFLEQYRPW